MEFSLMASLVLSNKTEIASFWRYFFSICILVYAKETYSWWSNMTQVCYQQLKFSLVWIHKYTCILSMPILIITPVQESRQVNRKSSYHFTLFGIKHCFYNHVGAMNKQWLCCSPWKQSCRYANLVVIVGNAGFHYAQCHQRWQSWHHDNSGFQCSCHLLKLQQSHWVVWYWLGITRLLLGASLGDAGLSVV